MSMGAAPKSTERYQGKISIEFALLRCSDDGGLATIEASCVRTTVNYALSLDIIMLPFHDQKRMPRLQNTAKQSQTNN
jgi:hypothetical protein